MEKKLVTQNKTVNAEKVIKTFLKIVSFPPQKNENC
jgi:hypothetical protein